MGKRILVADPDSVVQQVASYFLKLEGYDVEAVSDGVSAMEAIEKVGPDVIIMTPLLPGINGVEVSHFVRENPKYKTIPIVFLAERDEPLLNSIPELSQRFGIVSKPIDPTRLVNSIKEIIQKGPAPAENIAEPQKNIEELLGWEVAEEKVDVAEEVTEEKPPERSFDVTELLAGIIDVHDRETVVNQEVQFADNIPISCELSKENENPAAHQVCNPEFISVSQTMPGDEFQKQVREDNRNEIEEEFDVADHAAADIKNRITDEMIENMVRKIAADIVERVTREIVPDIAEREITKEIERLKGTE